MFWKRRTRHNKNIKKENEVKQLYLQNMGLMDQVENFKQVLVQYQQQYNDLSKKTNDFCMMILDNQYATDQLGGKNDIKDMNIMQLLSYAKEQYVLNHANERELLLSLTEQIREKDAKIEGLEAQISQYMLKKQHLEEFGDDIIDNENTGRQIEKKSEEKPKVRESSPIKKAPTGVTRVSVISEDVDMLSSKTNSEQKQGGQKEKKLSKKDTTKPKSQSVAQRVRPQATSREEQMVSKFRENVEQKTREKEKNDIKAHIVDLNDYMNKMNTIMWKIIKAIGEDGLSESKDLKKAIINNGVTESSFNISLTQLRKMNVIEQEQINTGWRWFHSYELSDIGRRIYLEKYKQNPIDCEKQILKKEHTTALHGYCIKDTSNILKAVFGYDEARTERKHNTMSLYTEEKYIPDVIATKKEGSLIDYFEVELGHHTQKDFNKKCDKMRMVTNNLHFVVPDTQTMNRLARQIGQWVLEKGGREKLSGITIYLTTLTKLNEGKWENVYPFN